MPVLMELAFCVHTAAECLCLRSRLLATVQFGELGGVVVLPGGVVFVAILAGNGHAIGANGCNSHRCAARQQGNLIAGLKSSGCIFHCRKVQLGFHRLLIRLRRFVNINITLTTTEVFWFFLMAVFR